MEARNRVGVKIAVWEQIAADNVSWDSTSLACITEEAVAPASTIVQENVGSGDKDPLTGTGLGTISFCGYTSGTRHYAGEAGTTGIGTISFNGGDHITSGTPCAGTVSAQECDMIAIRSCLDSSKKDEARTVGPCASGFRFKPKKSLLGRPRRVLRERNDDSTGSDESIEVVDSQQNWADSAAPSSGDSYKSDASQKENPSTNENVHVEVHKHSKVTKRVESSSDNILPNKSTESERNRKHGVLSEGSVQVCTSEQKSVSQPQSEINGKGSSIRITECRAIGTNLKPLDGLAELKEELQALQMLSKQRKLNDNARPISRTDSQPTPGAVINPVDVHEKSAVDRPSSNILKSIEKHNVREKEALSTEGGISGMEKTSPKDHVSGADLGNRPLIKDNGALNVSVNPLPYPTPKLINSQELCQQKDENPMKSQPKAVEARAQSPRLKALPESLTKGLPEETNRIKVDTVSRRSRENGHFVWVNNRRYQKLGKIGSGGSSDVFKVIAQDCTIYALKRIFLKGRDHQTACGFHQEIEYLERLRGKRHIIQLIDYEVTDKNIFQNNFSFHGEIQNDACIYMVLEYGEIDLARMLERKKKEASEDGQLDENWLRLYWEHILKAVNTIHEERIVHADLKPANFLLVQGVLKLIDFGIAKAIQNDTTNIVREAQVGTLNYMSPEAFMMNSRDEHGTVKCGRASDIWSLGCILYQMVYGRTPFSHLNFYHKITEITNPKHEIEFPPVSSPLIMDIMKSCLVWDKRKRPRIPQLLEHPFLRPKVTESTINQQCLREALLQCCKVYVSVKGTLELTELMRKVVKGNSESSSEHQLDEALLQLSRLYMQKAGKPALHELLTTLL